MQRYRFDLKLKRKRQGILEISAKNILLLILTDNLVFNLHNSNMFIKVVKTFDHLCFFVLIMHRMLAKEEIYSFLKFYNSLL